MHHLGNFTIMLIHWDKLPKNDEQLSRHRRICSPKDMTRVNEEMCGISVVDEGMKVIDQILGIIPRELFLVGWKKTFLLNSERIFIEKTYYRFQKLWIFFVKNHKSIQK